MPTDNTNLADALNSLRQAEEDAANLFAGTRGWLLKNIPKLTHEVWDDFVGRIGEGNFRIWSMSEGDVEMRDGNMVPSPQPWRRGYLLISPQGLENLKASVENAD